MRARNPSTDASPGRFDSPEQEAYLNLWRTYDRLRSLEDELFARFRLTPQQYNILRILAARAPEPMPTLAIASRLISRSPDITRMLDKLQAEGWILRRRPRENRRMVLVGITGSGMQLLETIAHPLRECHRRQLGHLDRSQLRRLSLLLREARRPHEAGDRDWG